MDLGRGNHGYLALVLSDADYNSIPNTVPFVAPTYLLLLTILSTVTTTEALELKDVHNE